MVTNFSKTAATVILLTAATSSSAHGLASSHNVHQILESPTLLLSILIAISISEFLLKFTLPKAR